MSYGVKSTTENNIRYSEWEAAAKLGIEVEELRYLVRRHFPDVNPDIAALQAFRPADLILLAHLRSAGVHLGRSIVS